MFGFNSPRPMALALVAGTALAGCVQTSGGGGGTAAVGGGDGPTFVSDENGCRYEVILGERYPIVDANGRQQCSSL